MFRFRSAAGQVDLGPDQAHVWLISMESGSADQGDLSKLLSFDEKERAGRFHFEKDRKIFITSRGALRLLLAGYTGREPASLRFVYSGHGKPSLPGPGCPNNPAFSISHSGTKILLAFSPGHPIGVDIEQMRKSPDFKALARRYFSVPESGLFLSLPEVQRPEAFYSCWVRKEAFLKAQGQGLSFGLASFEVSLRPGDEARLVRIQDDEVEAKEWTLYDLPVDSGYKAALATRARPVKLGCFYWPAGAGKDEVPIGLERGITAGKE